MDPSRKKGYFIETYGCQMNVNDSEKVAGLLRADGYQPAASLAEAGVVFINTCAVREKAAQKLFHSLGRLRKLKQADPELKISVGGCVAQLQGDDILARAPQVDVLVGTHTFARVPELLRRAHDEGVAQVDLDRKADSFRVPDELVDHSNPVRAYVTVMEGCNHVCSFCVVPRTRGPEVCRAPGDIVREVEGLAARGVPEVMLLGQTVNAYARDGVDFPGLLERVAAVDGLRRLRFTTSHPEHMTRDVARRLGRIPRLCPYIHLPFQCGSDRILTSMRRGYTAAHYRDTVAWLRDAIPGLAISGDAIVGYPGEGEADFQATVELVEEIDFDGLFVFAYSPRPGTTALRLTDDVPADEKKRRVNVLNTFQQRAQAARHARLVGTRQEVLVETDDGDGQVSGRTPHFKIVHFPGTPDWIGHVMGVDITAAGPNSLVGRLPTPSVSLTDSSVAPIF
jgi:tRNA-2-methylthio-N6-dimethylallyladenosine synthase